MRLPPALVVSLLLAAPAVALVPGPGLEAGTLVAQANHLLDSGAWLGKTPRGWTGWAQANFDPPRGALAPEDLALAVEHLYATLGVAATPAQRADLAARAAGLDPALAVAFGGLVASFDQVYERQLRDVAPLVDLTAPARGDPWLPPAAVEQGQANADALLAAVAALRVAVATIPPEAQAVPFADPLQLVVLGSTADETFTPQSPFTDPAVLVDLGGNDLDLTSAGGACPALDDADLGIMRCNGLAAALRVDLGGDDTYRFTRNHEVAQGSGGLGGLGVLVDVAGNDRYEVTQSTEFGPGAPGLGSYATNVVQGSGEGGIGVLLDLAGDDSYLFVLTSTRYTDWAQGQGFAGLGGFGALLDGAGDDAYTTLVNCPGTTRYWCGLYVQGTILYPGVAIMYDAAGDDAYTGIVSAPQEDYYSQAFAAFGGLAIQVDAAGNDRYLDSATSTKGYFAQSLNCAYGTAEYAGAAAFFLDLAGDDRYVSETISDNPPATMSEGFVLGSAALFWDVRGNDHHEMRAIGPQPVVVGRGTGMGLLQHGALYLDTGGVDTYGDTPSDQTVGAEGSAWATGADVNAVA